MRNRCFYASVVSFLWIFLAGSLAAQDGDAFVIRDVRGFDGEKTYEHRNVLIGNGKIRRVGGTDLKGDSRTRIIDGHGRTLFPGLFDAHVHISGNAEDALHQGLLLGVTSMLDMFTSAPTLAKIKRIKAEDPADQSDVRTAGIGAIAAVIRYSEFAMSALIPIANQERVYRYRPTRLSP